METILQSLQQSADPSIRYKVRTAVLGEDPESPTLRALREEIRTSPRVQTLLAGRLPGGRLPYHPYQKWRGAHWVLSLLADLGYPPGDETLHPLREQVFAWLLSPARLRKIPTLQGRVRHCASLEGNALYSQLALGIADERAGELAARLVRWQWPDGGWNCDKRPEAQHSSFMESLIPLRGLGLYARQSGDPAARAAFGRAAEFFLDHHLYLRHSTGQPIHPDYLALHYPCYWHYDILFGLTVMAETGCLADPRCRPAIDRLEALRLPGGGFPAARRYYCVTPGQAPNASPVDWGPTGAAHPNPFVTARALSVLAAAGRLETSRLPG